jgi:hypothetical protein
VLSVSPMPQGNEGGPNAGDYPHLKICFSIDSFADIPRDLQEEYARAERLRTAKEGPRCIITHQALHHSDLKPGDPIEVDFLLYGGGVITVSRIVAYGQDLTSRQAGVPSKLFKYYRTPTAPGAQPLAQLDPAKVGIGLRRAPVHV